MRRTLRIGLWAVALVGLIVVAVWLGRGREPAPAAPMSTSAPAVLQSMRLSVPESASADVEARFASGRPAQTAGCALERGPPAAGDAADAGVSASDAAVDAARQGAVARLVRSADPARRAAGLLLESRQDLIVRVRTCADDSACATAAAQTSPAPDRLAALARETDSAPAYATALQACGFPGTASGFCASLSTERWAQLAPQSAWPWVGLAGEARRRGDVSGVEYAMNHASQAADWRAVGAGFAALVIDELPADLPAALRFALDGEALAIEYSLFGALQNLTDYCPADAAPGRRQICLRLAERMLDRTDNLLGLKIAIRLGERSGVPESRLAALRDEVESLSKVGPMAKLMAASGPAGFGCADVARAAIGFEHQARMGELAALRERRDEDAPGSGSR